MSIISTFEVDISFIDSPGRVEEHRSSYRLLIVAGTSEQAIELAREFRPGCDVWRLQHAGYTAILGISDGLEQVARAQYDDGLLCSDNCRRGHHNACYGRSYYMLPDGAKDRPCECPCHAESAADG